MPKMKSNRAAKKRFRPTASGKLRYRHKNRSHILTKKTTKRKRQLRKAEFLTGQDHKNMKKLISA